jgi:hypothetical protein
MHMEAIVCSKLAILGQTLPYNFPIKKRLFGLLTRVGFFAIINLKMPH